MVDFKKLNEYIAIVENGDIPKDLEFNEFAKVFYEASQPIQFSKYLKSRDNVSKIPKLMNMKKAGELLLESDKNEEIKGWLKRRGYKKIPQLDYKIIMVLRKVELRNNWERILTLLEGKGTVQEINDSLRPKLLPNEITKLEEFIMEEMNMSSKELNSFLNKFEKVLKNKEVLKSIKKLIQQS